MGRVDLPRKVMHIGRPAYLGEVKKIWTPIVCNENPLFKPDTQGRGSENPDFCRASLIDGPKTLVWCECPDDEFLF